MKAGALGFFLATALPAGFRPTANTPFIVHAYPGVARVDVYANGQMKVEIYAAGGSNAQVSLDRFRYRPAPP